MNSTKYKQIYFKFLRYASDDTNWIVIPTDLHITLFSWTLFYSKVDILGYHEMSFMNKDPIKSIIKILSQILEKYEHIWHAIVTSNED